MTTQTRQTTPRVDRASIPLTHPQLPSFAAYLSSAVAVAAAGLVGLLAGMGIFPIVLLAWALGVVLLPLWSLAVEGTRRATDRLASGLIWTSFAAAMLPLISLLWQVVSKGAGVLSAEFLTFSMRNVIGEGGGIYHAIIGTALITGFATLMSVPVGVLCGIYLIEYGKGNRMARVITFLVDVMTGIPSIVAGLFAYALFVLIFGPGIRMGFGGSVALSVLMVPIVVRATEEMLKLVPDELREASYALGVPKWRTIVKVVLPTALSGIITGVTLSIARVAGETAPLLLIAGAATSLNWNPFSERMATLPVFIFSSITEQGAYPQAQTDRAWGAALVLIVIVMSLNLIARAVGRIFAPKTGR